MLPLLTLAAESEEPATLILAPWAFPLIAAIVFVLLAFVAWSYRDVANRHSDKTGGSVPGDHDGHGGQH